MKDTTFLFLFWGGTFSGWSQSERYHVSLSFLGGAPFQVGAKVKDTTFLFLFWGGTFSGWSQSERYHVSLSFLGGHLFRLEPK